MGQHPDRNAQFENIALLKQGYLDAGEPVISMDTKKKELLGTLYRNEHSIHKQPFKPMIMIFPALQQVTLFHMAFMTSSETLDTSHLERVVIPVNSPATAYLNGG